MTYVFLQLADFLKGLLTSSGLDATLAVVQTAYANGSSTQYIENTLVSLTECKMYDLSRNLCTQ